ncbi:hypothetical protein [Kitasatospora sp. NPDC018619]|uniref:hypothetical protein n=1 Tax=unclassified Kitasatospora TaxID=2633591 RepID=UPI003795D0E6
MAFSDGTAGTGSTAPPAPDYSPAAWPEPVALLPRGPLDPLGTVLIPPAERRLFSREPALAAPPAAAPAPVPPTGPPAWGGLARTAPGPLPVPPVPPAAPAPPAAPVPPAAPASPAAPVPPVPPARHPGPERPRPRRLTLPGSAEARRRGLLERVRVPLRACHRIAVLGGPADGLAAALGTLLAEHRAEPVLVLSTTGPAGSECRTGGRLVLRSVAPDPAALRRALDEAGGHYPVILADTAGAPAGVQLAAVDHADQLLLRAQASATGARTADALLDHLTALGRHDLVHGAAAVFTPAPPAERPIADRDLLPHFRARCRDALTLPHPDPAGLRTRTRLDYLELAALVGDAIAERQG